MGAVKRKALTEVGTADTKAKTSKSPGGGEAQPPTREEQLAAWHALAARLRSTHGGFIHPGVCVGYGGGDEGGGRGLVATAAIAAGEEIFRVPPTFTVTAAAALRSEVGRRVPAAVAAAAAAAASIAANATAAAAAASAPPRLALPDLALAAFIAVDVLNPASQHAPYYRLLDAETFDESPAWWPDEVGGCSTS
jgi:hypothetical protein